MGTRSTFRVIEKGTYQGKEWKNNLVLMYVQFDGYPEGHPQDTAKWLAGGKVVNGISLSETAPLVFNGAGCLAGQLVAKYKQGAGGVYICPISHRGKCGENYVYDIIVDSDTKEIEFVAYDNQTGWGEKSRVKTKELFRGTPADYVKWVNEVYATQD